MKLYIFQFLSEDHASPDMIYIQMSENFEKAKTGVIKQVTNEWYIEPIEEEFIDTAKTLKESFISARMLASNYTTIEEVIEDWD